MALLTEDLTAILLVKPTYKHADSMQGWQLPGGAAHADEPVHQAAARELLEETAIIRRFTHFVAFDRVPANPGVATEGYNIVVAGELTPEEIRTLAVPESATFEISAIKLVPLRELDTHAFPYQARRIREAVAAIVRGDALPLLNIGVPAQHSE